MENKQRILLRRELLKLQLEEKKLREKAETEKSTDWKGLIGKKIPEKVYTGLDSAFCTGFSAVFQHGRKLIELTYSKKSIRRAHSARDQAVREAGSRRDLQLMRKSVRQADNVNLLTTTAEGVALGALGVGMPDIVLFLATLLKGVYETALHYGFEYESPGEQALILKMLSASLKTGRQWLREDEKVDALLEQETIRTTKEELKQQIQKTASAFAMDMLVLKFIQGMPVVGFLGGAANPVYYRKIMDYVQRKYRKRYLLRQLRENNSGTRQ